MLAAHVYWLVEWDGGVRSERFSIKSVADALVLVLAHQGHAPILTRHMPERTHR